MRIGKWKQFFIILAAFLVLGISFKVMVLVEGLTEVRPVNAIPPVAGLICGPLGAAACAAGNLIADAVGGTFALSSILGIIGNFMAAYMPFRLWYLWSSKDAPGERPNLHSMKNIVRYVLISWAAATTVAWILSFGLYYFWGSWMEQIYLFVFWNDFGFSVGLGMPILIIFTSEGIDVECCKPPKENRTIKNQRLFIKNQRLFTKNKNLILKKRYVQRMICAAYCCLMLLLMGCVLFGHRGPSGELWMLPVSIAALAGLVGQLF